jgi:diphosphomevalonate decarboxylase
LSKKITGISNENKYLKASFLSRLGSGSASRSLYGPAAVWGHHKNIPYSSDQYAIAYHYLHENFKNYQDTILLIDKGTKKVSSTVGHELMHNHPFSEQRFLQANSNLESMTDVLKSGDLDEFISISESEALTLHAMMMTSKPCFILMKQGTLSVIEKNMVF